MYYEVKTKNTLVKCNGKVKTMNNLFFIKEAKSFAEAEEIVMKEYPDHEIKTIVISRVTEIISSPKGNDKIYYATLEAVEIAETGEVKINTYLAAVGAPSMVTAAKSLGEYTDTFVTDMRTTAIRRVKINRFI